MQRMLNPTIAVSRAVLAGIEIAWDCQEEGKLRGPPQALRPGSTCTFLCWQFRWLELTLA
eukprot:112409-Rhodomonas_salina.2